MDNSIASGCTKLSKPVVSVGVLEASSSEDAVESRPLESSLRTDQRIQLEKNNDVLRRALTKLKQLFEEEFAGLHARLLIARTLLWPLPIHVGGRIRVRIMRLIGFQVGHGTVMAGMPTITGAKDMYRNLSIGQDCWFNIGCLFDLGASIKIGKNVSFGHHVIILTTTHEIGPSSSRASAIFCKPVNIGSGVWLCARVTILPGVHIGDGVVVAAGSVVHDDIPPNSLVAGIPARVIKSLA